MDWLEETVCRFFGKSCSPERPSSKDLKHEMKIRGESVDKGTREIRHQRNITGASSSSIDNMASDVSKQWKNGRALWEK